MEVLRLTGSYPMTVQAMGKEPFKLALRDASIGVGIKKMANTRKSYECCWIKCVDYNV